MQSETDHQNPPSLAWQPSTEPAKPETQGRKKPQEVSWTASEFIDHQKSFNWYLRLGLAAVAAAVLVYLLTRDAISAGMVLVVAVILGIFAGRKPRSLHYEVNSNGIYIGDKFYAYSEFKSFAIIDEGALNSITLLPMKRFMPSISIYYDPEDEAKIANLLADYLPVEERQKDALDRFMHRIRF